MLLKLTCKPIKNNLTLRSKNCANKKLFVFKSVVKYCVALWRVKPVCVQQNGNYLAKITLVR